MHPANSGHTKDGEGSPAVLRRRCNLRSHAEKQAKAFGDEHDTHLLRVLLDQDEGIVAPILQKLGVTIPALAESINREIARYPKQSDASPTLSRELSNVVDQAEKHAKAFGDEVVSH